jgi:small subunit ribosomal protein S1
MVRPDRKERTVTEDNDDFASLFEASLQAKRFDEGQTIEGTIIAIGPEVAFIDVGGKGEATIDIEELIDSEGQLEAGVGDRIEAMVVSTSGGLKLSRKLARGAASLRQLQDAFHAGLPVEGKVERAVKGGYEVRIAGQRAFCPISQIDTVRNTEPSEHEGRVYTFRVLEFKEGGKNLVVSRRALIEEEQREEAGALRRSIVPGSVLTGRVASVREYGAFVDLGAGVQGLLHVSEMGWSRIADPTQVVRPGDEVTVKVLRIDDDGKKIALGLKQLQADPWSKVADTYAIGHVCPGRVTRVADFGAFVELQPGIEALAHLSTFPPTSDPAGWKAQAVAGMTGSFQILSIDLEKKRIGVALVADAAFASAQPAGADIVPGARLTGKVERHEKFGVFVFLAPGRTGLIPLKETGVAREADVARTFPVGSEVEVAVLEVDPSGRRIRLSRKDVLDAKEKDEVREYTERKSDTPEESFGSLAEKLRGAMRPKDRSA